MIIHKAEKACTLAQVSEEFGSRPHRLVPGIYSYRREGGKGRKTEGEGYMNFSFSTFKETAHIDVQFNGGVSISINVELLEDFLDDTMNVLQSLPQF